MAESSVSAFKGLLARLGAGSTRLPPDVAPSERTEVAARAPTVEIAPPTKEDVIGHIPADATIPQIMEYMEKYADVIEAGAYLTTWTDFAYSNTKSLSALEEAKREAPRDEVANYEWWLTQNRKREFDWASCVGTGEPNEKEEGDLTKMVMAMREMYDNDNITKENFWWLRKNHKSRFLIVKFYKRLINAQNNITSGVATDKPMMFKEVQTCNKIIAQADSIIQEFMANIHQLLRPIHQSKQLLLARRFAAATEAGMKVPKGGEALELAKDRGETGLGRVTKPDSAPRGKRSARDMVTDLDHLRQMRITKRSRLADFQGRPRASYRAPEYSGYRPASPPPFVPEEPRTEPTEPVAGDMTRTTFDSWYGMVKAGRITNANQVTLAALVPQPSQEDVYVNVGYNTRTDGVISFRMPDGGSRQTMLVLQAANAAIKSGALTGPMALYLAREKKLAAACFKTGLFLNAEKVAAMVVENTEGLRKSMSGGKGDATMGGT